MNRKNYFYLLKVLMMLL